MRQHAVLGAVLALLIGGATVVAAASPSPAPSATPKPSATAHGAATPAPTPTPSPTTSPSTGGHVFNATVNPLQISGSATVKQLGSGGGTLTIKVTGLLDDQPWFVDIDGGTVARPNEQVEIASKSGTDVMRVDSDTISVHLTKTEMAAFLRAQGLKGAVVIVSDGTRVGYAEFGAAA